MSNTLQKGSGSEELAGLSAAETWGRTLHQPEKHNEAREAVIREVSSWAGVTVHNHRFGGVEFQVGRRELGHIHSAIADLPFPRSVRDELIATGRAHPHHVLPDSGWVTVPMRSTSEAASIIELFRKNYKGAVRPKP